MSLGCMTASNAGAVITCVPATSCWPHAFMLQSCSSLRACASTHSHEVLARQCSAHKRHTHCALRHEHGAGRTDTGDVAARSFLRHRHTGAVHVGCDSWGVV